MACKRSEQCEHADICKYAKSNAYDILGGSCYRPKKPQTNEEYIQQCSTEQLVHFLIRLCSCGWLTEDKLDIFLNSTYFPVYNMEEIANLEKWLKQTHKE